MKKYPLRILVGALTALLLLILATGCLILWGGTGKEGDITYLIVLGTTVENDKPSSMLQDRIDAAAQYMEANPHVIAVVTGYKAEGDSISEAQCMYNGLTAHGISPERILIEEQATSTAENFQYSLALLKEEVGQIPPNIGVLSSEFHLLRAGMLAKHHGLDVATIPARTSDTRTFFAYFVREIFVIWYESAKLLFH